MSNTGGFQTQVNTVQPPAVEGDFCDVNPRATVDAGPGGLVIAAGGAYAARFCFLDPSNLQAVSNRYLGGAAEVTGFLARRLQGLNSTYLSPASMFVPGGFGVELFSSGGFWAKNSGANQFQPGQTVYASYADGTISNALSSAVVTGSVAASTFSVTGSIAGNLMTVSAVGSGVVVNGASISGTGVASGSKVISQVSGTTGGVGVYEVTPQEQAADSTTISGTYGTLTVSAVSSGALIAGAVLSGSGVDSGTYISQFLTGLGGTGTYVVSSNTVVGSTTITGALNVATRWRARSYANQNELVKISTWLQG